MAKHYRKMIVHGDHLEAPDAGPPWTVLWDTKPPANGEWSAAKAGSEQTALERAAHFVKLGFVVHAIKDPTGAVFMDQTAITGRFGATEDKPRRTRSERTMASAETAARNILRGFVEEYRATPGRALNASVLLAMMATQGVGPAEFERAVSYAEEHGWLGVAADTLTLTQAGYAAVGV